MAKRKRAHSIQEAMTMAFSIFRNAATGRGRAPPADSALNRADIDYLDRIRALPILSESAEHALVKRWYKHGDRAAYDELIAAHLRLVPTIAQKYNGYGIPMADLIGEGNLGLLHSVEKFDSSKGFRFSTYARWWIKASILNYVLHTWSLVKVGNGANKKRLFFNLRRAKRELQPEGERYLSQDQIDKLAHDFRVSREDLIAMDQRLTANDLSLSQPVGSGQDGDSVLVQDTIADEQPNAEERLVDADERAWQAAAVRDAMSRLDRREREILSRRYLSPRPVTLARLADVYGLTAERVRQIEAKAIDKLRQYLAPSKLAPA
jgi:RNA polymerase sigma-32 factor